MKKWMMIIVILILVILIAASFYFYNVAVDRSEKDFLNDNPDLEVSTDNSLLNQALTWMNNSNFETVSITSVDGLKLKGYYLEADKPTNQTVIIAHGYAGKANNMAAYANYYHETLNYNVLMPDARGHGASEGDYIGFGWPERKDYLQWIDYIIDRKGEDSKIALHGVSMGASTVLMTSGEKLPSQIKAIISDCGYTSAKDVLSYQMKRMYHLPSFPLVQTTSLLTKIRAGYSFGEASAIEQVKKTNLPILYIHGEADTFVPVEMVYELYAATPTKKDLYLVPKAEHGNAYDRNPDLYEEKVHSFLDEYMSNE
jgi:fermentation-respiration switch protein FrsA (DUF1100 family)